MKICILANAASVHTQRWAKAFAERGHKVDIISINSADIVGVNVHTVRIGRKDNCGVICKFLSYLYLLLTAGRRIRQLKPDVVNAHYASTHGVIAAFANYHPLVISVWGMDVIWDYGLHMPLLLKLPLHYALKRADLICSTSRFMMEKTLEIVTPNRPIEHIPFGINCELFKPSETPKEGKYTGQFRIGFVKALLRRYGPDFLVKAMPRICREVPNARLIMVGRGEMKYKLQQLAAELGVAEKIEFIGFVPNEQLPEVMRSFDVIAHPSIYPSESFGVVVVEASACGVPVVATMVGGVPEVCIDGKTGILVEPKNSAALAEAVIKLAKDRNLRESMGRAGREFVVGNYQWNGNVQTMLEILQRLVKEYTK